MSRGPKSHPHNDNSNNHNHHHHNKEPHVEHHHGLFKSSASLLAGIGLVTVLAHKHWPKGILHGDDDEWATKPAHNPHRRPSEHLPAEHHHHHHSSSSHHSSRDNNAELMIERAKTTRGRGNVVYYEEVIPVRKGEGRRRDLEAQGFERRASMPEERRSNPNLPYPEHAYPDERFYEPNVGRGRRPEAVYR